MRLGELLALKWSKIDLERRTIKIERTQTEHTDYETNSKIYEESTPKNKTSRRTIVINDFTYKWLMEQKRRTMQAGIESEYAIPYMQKELCDKLFGQRHEAGVSFADRLIV